MRLYVGIIKVTVKLELIVADLTIESGVAAPAFLFRKGLPNASTLKPGRIPNPLLDPVRIVDILAYRCKTVSTRRRSREYPYVSARRYLTRHTSRSKNCAGS